MARKVNQRTVDLVKQFEGYGDRLPDGRCIAYLDRNATLSNSFYDHKAGGLWTIGYGATGPGITKGVIWTQAKADSDLALRLGEFADQVMHYVHVPLNENELGALSSAAYNLGAASLHHVYDLINAGHKDQAADLLLQFNKGTVNGQKVTLRGLVRRRYAEKELFEWETPAEVVKMTPPLQDAQTVQTATAVGGFSLAGLWNYLPQVKEFMADHNGLILLGAVGLIFGVTQLYKWRQHQAFNNGTLIPVGTKPVPVIEYPEDAVDA